MDWGEWQKLPHFGSISDEVLKELVDGGQSFRWKLINADQKFWQGVFSTVLVQVRNNSDHLLQYRLPEGSGQDKQVREYFGCDQNWNKLIDDLPWRSDQELKDSIDTFPKLRILKQPLGETLFSFICSTAKQIPQIKQCCENVAERFGPKLSTGVYGWPGWKRLAEVSEEAIRECKLGYRAKYISAIARILAENDVFEKKVQEASYEDAKKMLTELPGVGEKVADCVLLFGAGTLEAFPVDTWIIKAMTRLYDLENWDASQVAHFGRVHFGKSAGLAQQFLFARERKLSV